MYHVERTVGYHAYLVSVNLNRYVKGLFYAAVYRLLSLFL